MPPGMLWSCHGCNPKSMLLSLYISCHMVHNTLMQQGLMLATRPLGETTPSYILHTCAFGTYLLGGGIYLAKKIIRWWYFTCKKPENIICDGILNVNMFHNFKIPYFTCFFFTKFTYNELYWTLFFIARCSTIFAQWSPRGRP
jgi:hypothetical protein